MNAPLQTCRVRHGVTAGSLTGQPTARSGLRSTPPGERMASALAAPEPRVGLAEPAQAVAAPLQA